MSISRLSLIRHRITTSFQTCNNNLLHHGLPSSYSSGYIGVRFFRPRPDKDFTEKQLREQLREHLLKVIPPVLSLDARPSLLQNQAIGMVAAAQANFMRVLVKSAAEKPRKALSKEEEEEPRVGVELLCVVSAVLKKVQRKVFVGDKVLVVGIDWVDRRGMIENVFQRTSQVMDPPVANVDHLLVLFSFVQPKLEALSVNRFLVEAESTNIPLTLALNKTELVDQETERAWGDRLRGWGYEPIFCSVESKRGLDSLEYLMKDQTTVIVGPSGVGKSSLINALRSKQHVSDTEQGINSLEQIKGSKWWEDQRVGEVSTRDGRGKHTTRNVSLLPISGGGYLADTPGFIQPSLLKATRESLALMFPEIRKMLSGPAKCKFNDCLHLGAPGCVVTGDWERYPYYLELLDEIKIREKIQYKSGDNGVNLVLKKRRNQSRNLMRKSLHDD